MPALPPVPRVIKTVVNFTINTVPACNVLHIQYAGAVPNNTQMALIAQNVHSYWSQNFIILILPGTILQSVVCQDLSGPLGAQGNHTVAIPGSAAGAPIPASNAVVGSWSIANRYRGGKPRTYISGLQQSELADPQHWNAQTVTSFTNAFTGFMNSINGMATPAGVGPFVLGCVHYKSNHASLVNPTFDPFTGVQVRSNVRSQRGRLS